MNDQISDMLTRIRNGQKIGLLKVNLYTPSSIKCIAILNILYKEGFIRGFIIIIFVLELFTLPINWNIIIQISQENVYPTEDTLF